MTHAIAHHVGVERSDVPSVVASSVLPSVVACPVSGDPDLEQSCQMRMTMVQERKQRQ